MQNHRSFCINMQSRVKFFFPCLAYMVMAIDNVSPNLTLRYFCIGQAAPSAIHTSPPPHIPCRCLTARIACTGHIWDIGPGLQTTALTTHYLRISEYRTSRWVLTGLTGCQQLSNVVSHHRARHIGTNREYEFNCYYFLENILENKQWLPGHASALYKTKKAVKYHSTAFSCCGTTRNRTGDTRIFSPLLYQLSYGTIIVSCLRLQRYDFFSKHKRYV